MPCQSYEPYMDENFEVKKELDKLSIYLCKVCKEIPLHVLKSIEHEMKGQDAYYTLHAWYLRHLVNDLEETVGQFNGGNGRQEKIDEIVVELERLKWRECIGKAECSVCRPIEDESYFPEKMWGIYSLEFEDYKDFLELYSEYISHVLQTKYKRNGCGGIFRILYKKEESLFQKQEKIRAQDEYNKEYQRKIHESLKELEKHQQESEDA